MKNISIKMLVILCIGGLLAGLAIGVTTVPWRSNVVPVTVYQSSTVTLTTDKTSYDITQQVMLTATLHDPTPATQQVVTFYFSRMSGANENTPIGTTDSTNSFIPLIDGNIVLSSVTTVNGVAHMSCSVGSTGPYFFRAEVLNPVS